MKGLQGHHKVAGGNASVSIDKLISIPEVFLYLYTKIMISVVWVQMNKWAKTAMKPGPQEATHQDSPVTH